jgi:hypothetical protein
MVFLLEIKALYILGRHSTVRATLALFSLVSFEIGSCFLSAWPGQRSSCFYTFHLSSDDRPVLPYPALG